MEGGGVGEGIEGVKGEGKVRKTGRGFVRGYYYIMCNMHP